MDRLLDGPFFLKFKSIDKFHLCKKILPNHMKFVTLPFDMKYKNY